MLIVLKSGNLNLLEPSGFVQACSGIALLFTITFYTEWASDLGVLFTTDHKVTQILLNSQSLESHVPLVHYLTFLIRTVSNKHDSHYYACASFNP